MLSQGNTPERGSNFSIDQDKEFFGRRRTDEPQRFDLAPNGTTTPQDPEQFHKEFEQHGFGLNKQQREQLLADFVLRNSGRES